MFTVFLCVQCVSACVRCVSVCSVFSCVFSLFVSSVCLCAVCFYVFSVLLFCVCLFSVFMIARHVSACSVCYRLTQNVKYPNILPTQTSAMAGGP